MGPDDDVSQGFSQGSQGQEGTGINPAWDDVMKYIPEENYNDVRPVLEQWDNNFAKVQSSANKYKDYEQFLEAGIEPDEIDTALGVLSAINTQPQEVLEALQNWVNQEQGREEGMSGPQGQGQGTYNEGDQGQGQGNSFDLTQNPEFQRLDEGFQTVAQILQEQREREEEQQNDAAIDQEFADAKQRLGEFDENYVIGMMIQDEDLSVDDAVKAYQEFENRIRSENRRPSPRVLGSSGQIPSNDIDPRKLDRKGTRDYVADILREQQREER